MRLIDADALLKKAVEADRMGAMLVVGKGFIMSAPTVVDTAVDKLLAEVACLTAERDAAPRRAEAKAIPENVIDAVEEIKHAVAYNGHAELSRACSELWRVWDEWRGPEPSGEGKP